MGVKLVNSSFHKVYRYDSSQQANNLVLLNKFVYETNGFVTQTVTRNFAYIKNCLRLLKYRRV